MVTKVQEGEHVSATPPYSLDPYDLTLIAALLAVAIFTYPFAFECCAVLMMAFTGVREALARSRYSFVAAVAVVVVLLANSDDALRFVLHRNVFAPFSSDDFLARRQASIIETFAMLLSFCCLLLLPSLAAAYRTRPPKLGSGLKNAALIIGGAIFTLPLKWNHFVAQIDFLQRKSPSFTRIDVTTPDPTSPVVALMLAAITLVAGSCLIMAVQTIKSRWRNM